MSPNMSPDPWNLRSRVPRTIRAIQDLTEEDLAKVIWSRIKGEQDARLPKFERGEYPSDLFIDLVKNAPEHHGDLLQRIKKAAALILIREAEKAELTEAGAIAETMFLAARIGAAAAIDPVSFIATNPDSEERRVGGEELRSRALRALLGKPPAPGGKITWLDTRRSGTRWPSSVKLRPRPNSAPRDPTKRVTAGSATSAVTLTCCNSMLLYTGASANSAATINIPTSATTPSTGSARCR